MNYRVPDFGLEEEDPFASAFDFPNLKILQESGDNDLAEILWQKGPVLRRLPVTDRTEENANQLGAAESERIDATANNATETEVFIGEDEMASWLHYSPENDAVGGGSVNTTAVLGRRQIPPFSPPPPSPQSTSITAATTERALLSRESNVVRDLLPPPPPPSRLSTVIGRSEGTRTCDTAVPSSMANYIDDRKRKGRDFDDSDSEDVDYDSDDKKKDRRRPARRTRAAEVHNLSERRRRDRINEKMKALQQLIPRCNKSDKASMLDDAVEYLKSLQLQIQMMSMGCPMTPMMYPGLPQYLRPIGMTMGMGIDTSSGCMTHPLLPFPAIMQHSSATGATTAPMGARIPMPVFYPASTKNTNGQPGAQTPLLANRQPDAQPNFICLRGPTPVQIPDLPSTYHHYFGCQPMQIPPQTRAFTEPGANNGNDMPEK